VHASADLAGGERPSVPLDDCERVERGMRQSVTTRDVGDERFDSSADDLELAERSAGEPRCSRILTFERVGFEGARRGGARFTDATLLAGSRGVQLTPRPRSRCAARS
jgi:hypothetical protein